MERAEPCCLLVQLSGLCHGELLLQQQLHERATLADRSGLAVKRKMQIFLPVAMMHQVLASRLTESKLIPLAELGNSATTKALFYDHGRALMAVLIRSFHNG
jgi:hypothetical protein